MAANDTAAAQKGPKSYFPSIEAKYGRSIAEWIDELRPHAGEKHMDQVAFLKEQGMGHGHDRQQPGTGLFPGHPTHVFLGRLCGLALFGEVQVEHAETHPQAGQQLCPTGRFGCEIKHM